MAKSNRKDSTQLALRQKHQSRSRRRLRTAVSMIKKIGASHTTTKRNRRGTSDHLILHHERSISPSRRSYLRMLRYIARTGRRINSTSSTGETALHLAVKYDDFKTASQLIRLGADVNRRNRRGETPLQVAVVNSTHVNPLEMIPNGVILNKLNFYGFESLRLAVAGRDQLSTVNSVSLRLVKMLLDAGALVNTNNNDFCSPLQCAVYTGDVRLVKILVDAGANINSQSGNIGSTPLHDAVFCCNEELVHWLLSRGADVSAKAPHQEDTPLHWASMINIDNSYKSIIRKLLEFGGKLNEENIYGITPFNNIIEIGDVNLARLCIEEYGADLLGEKNSKRRNALMFAVRNTNRNVMNLVQESARIEVNHTCLRHKRIPLHYASQLSMLENVRQLISRGADVNATDMHGLTPLTLCLVEPYSDQREYMIEPSGLAIIRANFIEERKQVIRLLLDCGSDVTQKIFTDGDPKDQETILEFYAFFREEGHDLEALHTIIEHLAKVPLLDDRTLRLIDEDPEMKSHYQICRAELAAMKTAKIEGTRIAYFSVLTESLDVLARYARNEDFVNAFLAGEHRYVSSIYASQLHERFTAALARLRVIERACDALSLTLRFADSSHPAFENILKYLSETDVASLVAYIAHDFYVAN